MPSRYGASSNCGASPPIWSHAALDPTKMWAPIRTPGSPSMLPRVTPCTCPLCVPHRVVPHRRQKTVTASTLAKRLTYLVGHGTAKATSCQCHRGVLLAHSQELPEIVRGNAGEALQGPELVGANRQ